MKQVLLFIDTQQDQTTRLVLVQPDLIFERSFLDLGALSESLVENIGKFLRLRKVRPSQITKLAVIVGPGGFGRIRSAVAVANALAFALDLPVVSVKAGEQVDFLKMYKSRGEKQAKVHYPKTLKIKTKK